MTQHRTQMELLQQRKIGELESTLRTVHGIAAQAVAGSNVWDHEAAVECIRHHARSTLFGPRGEIHDSAALTDGAGI